MSDADKKCASLYAVWMIERAYCLLLLLPLSLSGCTGEKSVSSVEAAGVAERALFLRYPDAFSSEQKLRLEHKVDLKGGKWRVYFSDPEAGTGGDASMLVDRQSGQVTDIGRGQ